MEEDSKLIRFYFTISLVLSHTLPVLFYQSFLMVIGYLRYFESSLSQPDRKVDSKLLKKCLFNFCISHFFVYPVAIYFGYPYFSPDFIEMSNIFPSLNTILPQLLLFIFVEDCLFYWSHRILHSPALYKRYHKQHHEFKILTGFCLASEYADPVESLIGNVLPVLAGPFLSKLITKKAPHLLTVCLWIIIRMFKTCDAHSGYRFTWSPFNLPFYPFNSSDRHDFHHETACGSFGSFFCIWETLCGTDKEYRERLKQKSKITINNSLKKKLNK